MAYANKEREREYQREYRKLNAVKLAQRQTEWRSRPENQERVNESRKRYNENNQDKVREQQRLNRERNAEVLREKRRARIRAQREKLESLRRMADELDLAIIQDEDVYCNKIYKLVDAWNNADVYPLRWYYTFDEIQAALDRHQVERNDGIN